MNVLLAIPLLLVGPEAPPVSGEVPAGMISFEVRQIECEAIGWREAYQSQLHFGGHRAGCSAWVAELETLTEMSRQLTSAKRAKVVNAPAVVASFGSPAIIGTCSTRHFVVHTELPETTPTTLGEATGPRPVIAPVDDGSQIRLVGLPRPEGMLLKVEVMDTRVVAVHEAETTATIGPEDHAKFRVQIPEVTHREMGGEWLLPSAYGLVLSLGVKSEDTGDGQSQLRERLLLISMRTAKTSSEVHPSDPEVRQVQQEPVSAEPPGPVPTPTTVVQKPHASTSDAVRVTIQPGQVPSALAATPWGLLPIVPVEIVTANAVEVARPENPEPMPLPTLPSRTLPPAIGTDGQLVDPRTDKDRAAERTDFRPYVDGQPVPSPQVTIPPPSAPVDEGYAVRTKSNQTNENRPLTEESSTTKSKRDESAVTVRLSLDLVRGFTVDVDLGESSEADQQTADAVEPPIRR